MTVSVRLKDVITASGNTAIDLKDEDRDYIAQIIEALEVAHSALSIPEVRWKAYVFLDKTQSHHQAAFFGAALASDPLRPAVVRHYGLSLLERAVALNRNESTLSFVGRWMWQLASSVRDDEPTYFRNQIAKLWVELAKLYWPREWLDMDELLVVLWSKDLVHKELVAAILDNLSDDVFGGAETPPSRVSQVGPACVDIFTMSHREPPPSRVARLSVKYGTQGWLCRLAEFLDWSMPEHVLASERIRACTLRVLAAIKSAMRWASFGQITAARCNDRITKGLVAPCYAVQLACVETILALTARPTPAEEFGELFAPIYSSDHLEPLRQLHEWAAVDPENIDDDKYVLAKKLAELISISGTSTESRLALLQVDEALHEFLKVLTTVLASQSLSVSLPALKSWWKLLKLRKFMDSAVVDSFIGPVLDICSSRLLKFELLPEGTEEPIVLFLNEDLDSAPDLQAFLADYRRHCASVIELMIYRRLCQGLPFSLDTVEQTLQGLSQNQPVFDAASYKRFSPFHLTVDAQLAVFDAAVRGYGKWLASRGDGPETEQRRVVVEEHLEKLGGRLLQLRFEDPLILKRVLQTAVTLSTSALKTKEHYILCLLKYIFTMQYVDNADNPIYAEAMRDLREACTSQLHQLAVSIPDFLITFYDELDSRVNELINSQTLDDRQKIAFRTFLFMITHRCLTIKSEMKVQRMMPVVNMIQASWEDPEFERRLQSFGGFCELVGVTGAQDYLYSHGAHSIRDWSSFELDEEGKTIQTRMGGRFMLLPLKLTKSFLMASVDRNRKGSEALAFSTMLWRPAIAVIIPRLLKLLGYSHTFYDASSWGDASDEMRSIAARALNDRFWQSGISTGSRDEFYARVNGTRMTMEGFASTLRAAVRNIREACYSMLCCMSRLELPFYCYDDLPQPLARALLEHAGALSSHQFSMIISVSRTIIDECPKGRREVFLTPLIPQVLALLDSKITAEWNEVARRNHTISTTTDVLTEEMRDESVLRQLTHSSAMLVASLLDPMRDEPSDRWSHEREVVDDSAPPDIREQMRLQPKTIEGSMRAYVLSTVDILRQLMSFCTHVIQIPDTRSSSVILRVLTTLSRDFLGQTELGAAMREYMSGDVLKAAITSLHDPRLVDVQRDLISLVIIIYVSYSPLSPTARNNLMSLPGVTEERMQKIHTGLFTARDTRQTRSLMLSLLEGVRAVSISEQGRVMFPPINGAVGGIDGRPSSSHSHQRERKHKRASAGRKKITPTSSMMMMSLEDDNVGGGGGGGDGGDGESVFVADRAREREQEMMEHRKSPDLTGVADLLGPSAVVEQEEL